MITLAARDLKKTFLQGDSTIEVLKEITASFERNHTYAITGPSGSGKSTLMHLLAGLDKPTHGTVLFEGKDVARLSTPHRKEFLNKSVGLVFQLPYLIRELSVIENVMLKDMIAGNYQEESKDTAHTLLKKMGLHHKAAHSPFSLSGGEQQRIAIARAIFNKPKFLLADEPTGNLDVKTGKLIVELLVACQEEWQMGIIVSSHDAYVAERMTTVLHLENGLLQ
ncbi:MAG: ABC transporter ATP-binding protein [Candidatus Dependentiae bacterium]|nr:ABC transporter ATP-binding protein [Candidatus Dependentiae bacterium]